MKFKRRIQKRSFLLFEIVISLALISLCLFPLIQPHAKMRKIEQQELEFMYFEREAATAFCYLKTKLYSHSIPWEKLVKNKAKGEVDEKKFFFQGKEYTCTYEMYLVDDSHKKNGDICALFNAEISFTLGEHDVGPYDFAFVAERKQL